MSESGDVYLDITDPKGYMRGWEGWDHKERKYVLSLLSQGESFLDVGCGGGITYESIKKLESEFEDPLNLKYKGVDYSQKFIEACKEMYPEAEWEVQDVLNLSEKDDSWDVVYLRNMVENCPYFDTPIEEAFRVAKRLVIVTLWQPLGEVDCIQQLGPRTWGNRYSKHAFYEFLRSLKKPFSFRYVQVKDKEGGRQLSRLVYVIKKSGPF